MRCPKTWGSSQAAIRSSPRALHGAAPPGTRQSPHAALARHDQRAVAGGQHRRDRLAVVLLREREGLAAVAAHEHHARQAADHDAHRHRRARPVQERRGAGLDRGPVLAAIVGAEQVAAQAEGQQRLAVERQQAEEASRRRATAARARSRRRRRSGTAGPPRRRCTGRPRARPRWRSGGSRSRGPPRLPCRLPRPRPSAHPAAAPARTAPGSDSLPPSAVNRHAVGADRDAAHAIREPQVEQRLLRLGREVRRASSSRRRRSVLRMISSWPTAQPCWSSEKYTAVRLRAARHLRLRQSCRHRRIAARGRARPRRPRAGPPGRGRAAASWPRAAR